MTKKGAIRDFFFIFGGKNKIKRTIFSYQPKESEEKMRLPNWPQLGPPAGQETYFFRGGSLREPMLGLYPYKVVYLRV